MTHIDNYKDFEFFRASIESEILENEQKEIRKANTLKRLLENLGTTSEIGWIEGKEVSILVNRNFYLNGDQLFEVLDKTSGDRFLAYYYSTENSFVDALYPDKWHYNVDVERKNQLDNYKALPVFINYK